LAKWPVLPSLLAVCITANSSPPCTNSNSIYSFLTSLNVWNSWSMKGCRHTLITFFSFSTLFCCLCATISVFSIAFNANIFFEYASCTKLTLPNVPDPSTAICFKLYMEYTGLLVTLRSDPSILVFTNSKHGKLGLKLRVFRSKLHDVKIEKLTLKMCDGRGLVTMSIVMCDEDL
jgi:hypothetical protein